MAKNAVSPSQVNPQRTSQVTLSLPELPSFWAAQQGYFNAILSNAESQQIRHPLVDIFVRDSALANKNMMGFLSSMGIGCVLLAQGLETDSDFFVFLSYLLLAASLYFGIKLLHSHLTGQGRGKAAYQKELGRSFFLQSFFEQLTAYVSPQTKITGHMDHRSHRAYSNRFDFKRILEPDPVENIEKKVYQSAFLWASLDFILKDGSPMRLQCFDVVPEGVYTDRKKIETYRFELSGPQIYPNPFVLHVRPPDPDIGKLSTLEPEWVEHPDPQLFTNGKYLGHMLAYNFQRVYLALV